MARIGGRMLYRFSRSVSTSSISTEPESSTSSACKQKKFMAVVTKSSTTLSVTISATASMGRPSCTNKAVKQDTAPPGMEGAATARMTLVITAMKSQAGEAEGR